MSVIGSMYNRTFTVSRKTRTSDGKGGWRTAYAEIGAVDGRIRPATSAERTLAAQEQRQISHVLYVDADEDIERGDQVEADDGLLVDVQGVREPSRAGHHLEVDCMETQREATAEYGS